MQSEIGRSLYVSFMRDSFSRTGTLGIELKLKIELRLASEQALIRTSLVTDRWFVTVIFEIFRVFKFKFPPPDHNSIYEICYSNLFIYLIIY